MSKVKNILFVGVGGQGTILASKILCEGLMEAGFDIKMSEVHGMAQRGGSVVTQVRYGEKVYSPIIEKGKADIIAAFEKSEAVRYLEYLKKDGHIIVNNQEIYPMTVLTQKEKYPENINESLRAAVSNTIIVDAVKTAEGLGNSKAQNIVLLGSLIKVLGLYDIDWNRIIEKTVPQKAVELNIKAFKAGMSI